MIPSSGACAACGAATPGENPGGNTDLSGARTAAEGQTIPKASKIKLLIASFG